MTVLRELIARIKLDTSRATRDLKKYDKALDEVKKKTEAVTKSTKKVGEETEKAAKKTERAGKKIGRTWKNVAEDAKKAAQKAAKAGKSIGAGMLTVAAGVTAAAAGVFEFTKQWSEATAEIGSRASKLGVATDGLQELRFAATRTSASAETMDDVLKELQVRLAEAALTGMGPLADASEILGIDFVELAKKTPIEAFVELRRELGKVENTMEQTFLSEELLGEQGVELGKLINLTEAEFEALRKKAQETGQVLSGETLEAAAEFNEELRDTKGVIGVVVNEVAVELLPVVKELVVEFREWIKENDELVRSDLAKTLGETAKAGAEIVKVFGQVLSLTNDVNDATGGLTNTLKALGAVAVGIKLATFGPVGIAAAALLGVKVGADIIDDKRRQTAKAEDKLAAREVTVQQRNELSKTAEGRATLDQIDRAQRNLDATGTSLSTFEAKRTESIDEFSHEDDDDRRHDAERKQRRDIAIANKASAFRVIELLGEIKELDRLDAAEAKQAAAEAAKGPVFGIAGTDLDPVAQAKKKAAEATSLAKRQKAVAKLRKRLQDKGKPGKKKKEDDDEEALTFGELLGFGKGGATLSSTEGRGLGTTIVNQRFEFGIPSIKLEITAAPGATVREQAEATVVALANLGPELLKRTQRAATGALS